MLDGEDISWIDTGFDVNDLRAGGRGFGWCYACHGCTGRCRDISAVKNQSTCTVGNYNGCSCSGRSIKIAVL